MRLLKNALFLKKLFEPWQLSWRGIKRSNKCSRLLAVKGKITAIDQSLFGTSKSDLKFFGFGGLCSHEKFCFVPVSMRI